MVPICNIEENPSIYCVRFVMLIILLIAFCDQAGPRSDEYQHSSSPHRHQTCQEAGLISDVFSSFSRSMAS